MTPCLHLGDAIHASGRNMQQRQAWVNLRPCCCLLCAQLTTWHLSGISILAGLLTLLAGLTMWLTSMAPIRKRLFVVFYAVHHLYLVFFVFFVFHVGLKTAGYTMGAMFLFFVDRFIRWIQSRQSLTLLSAKIYPSRVMELRMRTSPGMVASMENV